MLNSPSQYGMRYGMAAGTKATFSLDRPTIQKIDSLAERWGVSKTEVLRRAITRATEAEQITVDERIDALHTLQRWVKEKKIDTDKWRRTIKDGRR